MGWLNQLELNSGKTEVLLVSRNSVTGIQPNLEGVLLPMTGQACLLGVLLDSELLLDSQQVEQNKELLMYNSTLVCQL